MPLKFRLLTPGPTMIPERVQMRMALPILHHRSPEFKPIFSGVQEKMKRLFSTRHEVLILASSGTGAMEAAIANIFEPGEKIIAIEGGKFGERWTGLGKRFGLQTVPLSVEWGNSVKVEQIDQCFRNHKDAKAIFFQACETSTGANHPVKAICDWRNKNAPDVLVGVDGITAVGCMPLPMDAWGINIMLTGSQKALMLPPGLALISLDGKAWEKKMKVKNRAPYFYFDLEKELANQKEQKTTSWTPAISLISGLDESLKMLEEEGYENVYKRHDSLGQATRAAGTALGIELFAKQSPSPSITAFKVPKDIDGEKMVKILRDEHGFTVAGGQDQMKGMVFRIGHMGYTDAYDLIGTFGALERVLKTMNWKNQPSLGTSVSAFLKSLEGAR